MSTIIFDDFSRRMNKLLFHAANYGVQSQHAQDAMAALVRGQFQHLLAPIITGHFQVIDYYGRKWEVHSIDNPVYRDPGRDGILLPGWKPTIDWSVEDATSYTIYNWDDFVTYTQVVKEVKEVEKVTKPLPIGNGSLIGECVEIENLYSWSLCMDERWRESAQRKKKAAICGAFWRQRSAHCRLEHGHAGSHQGQSKGGLFTYIWTDEDMIHKRKISTTALTGWRVWKCVKGPRLKSVTADREWDSPVMRTRPGSVPASWLEETTIYSQSDGRQLPHPLNESFDYGIYAYKTPMLCWEKLLQFDRDPKRGAMGEPQYLVIGSMDLSGIVVEHELGYRAEIAAVRELWYISNDFADALGEGQRRVRELAEFYKCDVHLLAPDQIHGWARWYTDGQ